VIKPAPPSFHEDELPCLPNSAGDEPILRWPVREQTAHRATAGWGGSGISHCLNSCSYRLRSYRSLPRPDQIVARTRSCRGIATYVRGRQPARRPDGSSGRSSGPDSEPTAAEARGIPAGRKQGRKKTFCRVTTRGRNRWTPRELGRGLGPLAARPLARRRVAPSSPPPCGVLPAVGKLATAEEDGGTPGLGSRTWTT
jgi:hypothetical protein